MNMTRHPSSSRPQASITPRTAAPVSRPGVAIAPPNAAGRNPSDGRPNVAAPRTGKAEDIFMVLRQLSDLLIKENAALKRYRAEEVKALAERKDRLAVLYQHHMTAIQRDPTLLKSLDLGKRTMLMQLATRLADLMRDNAAMLKANIQSIDTFFQAVNDAVRERQEKKAASYSREGLLNSYATSRRNLAVTYNQTT